MDEIERYQYMLHAKTNGFKRKVERANDILYEALMMDESLYCAFSGGIDSSCMLDLLYQHSQGFQGDVLFGDEGWDYPETIQFLHEAETRYGFQLRLIRDLNAWRKTCQELDRPELAEAPDTPGAWHNPFTTWEYAWDKYNPHLMPTMQYGGVFLGMLASESRARRITLQQGHRVIYQVKYAEGKAIYVPNGRDYEWHCCPLANFAKQDVWAYVISRDIPYNPVYDRLAELGVPLEKRRVAALSYMGVAHFGSHAVLRSGWPELYNKLCATFPRVREYS